MNKWILTSLLIIGYCTPFVFLAMYGDANHDTMLIYLLMILGFGILCLNIIKSKQFIVLIVGNIFSFTSSYICIQQFYNDIWGWYFKPFTANGLLIAISVIAIIVQIIFVYCTYKKQLSK